LIVSEPDIADRGPHVTALAILADLQLSLRDLPLAGEPWEWGQVIARIGRGTCQELGGWLLDIFHTYLMVELAESRYDVQFNAVHNSMKEGEGIYLNWEDYPRGPHGNFFPGTDSMWCWSGNKGDEKWGNIMETAAGIYLLQGRFDDIRTILRTLISQSQSCRVLYRPVARLAAAAVEQEEWHIIDV
jgi:hypothetical protein